MSLNQPQPKVAGHGGGVSVCELHFAEVTKRLETEKELVKSLATLTSTLSSVQREIAEHKNDSKEIINKIFDLIRRLESSAGKSKEEITSKLNKGFEKLSKKQQATKDKFAWYETSFYKTLFTIIMSIVGTLTLLWLQGKIKILF